jgi:Ser/Thr protein kinase RdoA (MazF antagonist)
MTPIASRFHGLWNVGGRYILKYNVNKDELKKSIKLSQLLTGEGIPVSRYIPATNGAYTDPDGEYCLMEKLAGEHADFYDSPTLAAELGRELARLHAALARIEPEIECVDYNSVEEWNNYIKPNLAHVDEGLIMRVEAKLLELYPKLPRQLIHRDVHLGNVLFVDGRLSGWLDFDLGQRNARIFDIAYLLSGLLAGRLYESDKINIWRGIYRDMLNGYNEINFVTDTEYAALPVIIAYVNLLFTVFMQEHNDLKQSGDALKLAKWICEEFKI